MSLPFMRMFWADYFGDTRHLSTIEHGAYLLLIGHYWERGKLPTDDERLRRICGLSAHQWDKLKPTVAAFFSPDWKHRRIEQELQKAAETRLKRQIFGRKGGEQYAKNLRTGGMFSEQYQRDSSSKSSSRARAIGGAGLELPEKKERNSVLTSEPREASSNFTVRRGGGLGGFDPSAAMREKLIEAAQGNVTGHAREDVSPITRLRAKGCNLEQHILPAIAELVPMLEQPLRSWSDATLLAEILKRQERGLGEGRERVPLREGDTDQVAASLERLAKGRVNGLGELDVRSAPDALDSSVPDGTVLS